MNVPFNPLQFIFQHHKEKRWIEPKGNDKYTKY
jgi:hypothetical protein